MKHQYDKPPQITKELIEWLSACFPKRKYLPDESTIETVMFEEGKQEMIDILHRLYDEQQNK